MEDEVGSAIHLSIDLILTAIIISVIATFATVSYKAYNTKMRADSVVDYLELKGKFYNYDSKTVSGSDIISVIENNARMYKFEIKTNHGTYVISTENERRVLGSDHKMRGKSIWSADYIKEILGKDVFDTKFKSELVYSDKNSEVMIGIKFTQEGVS